MGEVLLAKNEMKVQGTISQGMPAAPHAELTMFMAGK
jgi:hypothetical protein